MYRFRIFLAAVYLFTCFFAFGQNDKVNHTGQFWGEVDLAGKIVKKWKWQVDLQYSRQSPYSKPNLFEYNSQLTIRPWIHFYPTSNIRMSGFFGLWYNFPIPEVGAREYPEWRGALQASFYTRGKYNLLVNRLRPELRIMKDRQGKYEAVFRGRYQLKYQRLLTHESYDRNSFYFIIFDEIFVNGGSNVTGRHLFDQNRIFIGFGYNVTDNIAIETGYFNQFQQHAHDDNLDMNHCWQLTLILDNLNAHHKLKAVHT